MNQAQFEETLRIVQQNYRDGKASLFWCGYSRGLRRAFHGRSFTTDMDHAAWLQFHDDPDPCVAELGRGYRAGLAVLVEFRGTETLRERLDAMEDAGP
jgi:hypothetical protein